MSVELLFFAVALVMAGVAFATDSLVAAGVGVGLVVLALAMQDRRIR